MSSTSRNRPPYRRRKQRAQRGWPALALLLCACAQARTHAPPTPVYANEIARLLEQRCGQCHGEDDAGDGFRVSTYLDTLGCPRSSPHTSAAAKTKTGTPLLDVLERPDHARLLDAGEKARLRAWIAADAPLREHTVHAPGILNPHSDDWHGRLAARDHYGPITSAKHPDVCGRCHDGAPVKPKGVTHPAPGATACSTCHQRPEAVLACGTCHGDGAARAYPPRDRCLFPASKPDAHRAHVESTRLSATALSCTTCHPAADATLRGTHADGKLEVVFDAALAGTDAHYDPVTGVCAVRCHNQGGARAMPTFKQPGPLGCGDCHGAPPREHYAGTCDRCHASANADGTALRSPATHMNGEIDLGNGSGDCAACHGKDGDPMPPTPSHILHRTTLLTAPIDCSECHVVPKVVSSAGHLDVGPSTPADVVFGARARARGQQPSYEAGTCKQVACHGAGLADRIERALRWDAPAANTCVGCHGLPPSKDHPKDDGCASLICHGAEITAGTPDPAITQTGRALHIDGQIETHTR
jgi:predicted CxxxxCH...CXXCH cytochrome family protein